MERKRGRGGERRSIDAKGQKREDVYLFRLGSETHLAVGERGRRARVTRTGGASDWQQSKRENGLPPLFLFLAPLLEENSMGQRCGWIGAVK